MNPCARGTTWAVGLAAGLLSLLAHASFMWQVEGQVPVRIDIATAATRSVAEPGPVDAIVPLPDGGAWMRRGSELIRLAPDLRVAARASVALAGPMHWEPQSRRLWVVAGRDLLRYDEHLVLEGAVRFDVELRAVAGSGPEAIWVATDTRLLRVQRDGEPVDAVELSSMALDGTVAGVLSDTPRARVWVVAASGEMVAIDAADGLRPAGMRQMLSPDAQAVIVDAASGAIRQFARGAWRSVLTGAGAAAMRGRPCPGCPAGDRRAALRQWRRVDRDHSCRCRAGRRPRCAHPPACALDAAGSVCGDRRTSRGRVDSRRDSHCLGFECPLWCRRVRRGGSAHGDDARRSAVGGAGSRRQRAAAQ